jgi:hypothetical protein
VSRLVTVDLDSPDAQDLDRLWAELQSRHAARLADPELYQGIVGRLDAINPKEADQVRAELGRSVHPRAVLAGHWRSLVSDRPALGAFLIGRR